ncbi:RING finger protein [Dirofilaria immitis]
MQRNFYSNKKTNNRIYLYHIDDENQCSDYTITGIDMKHKEDTIFDIAFLDDKTICLILQNYKSNLYITKGTLNFELKLINICSLTTFTQIICKKHYATSVIYDETGPVLISYPLSSQNKTLNDSPKIWLLHLSNFYSCTGVRTVVIEPSIKDRKALFCDPFIYQNCVYLFNRFESTILSIAITGKNRARTRILNTHPDFRFQKPSSKYANRCLFLLRNIILVYCHQRLDKHDEEPELWILKLKTMTWHRLHLILNHHYPIGLVNFQKSRNEELAYLHGECGRSKCQEKVHLYQLSTTQDCIMPNEPNDSMYRASLIDRKKNKSSKRSVSNTIEIHHDTSNGNVRVESTAISEHIAPSFRYVRRYNRDKAKKNLHPSSSSSLSAATKLAQPNQQTQLLSPLLLSPSKNQQDGKQYVHWSEEMAEEGDIITISEQLRLAKDMGYSDDEIMQAISMNCARDGSYRAFSSTNAMIDMLARVQRMCETAESICSGSGIGDKYDNIIQLGNKNDAGLNRSSYGSLSHTPGLGIRRAISFHAASSSSSSSSARRSPDLVKSSFYEYRSSPPQFQLQRLLDAFEREQKSFNDESTRSIRALEERCRQFADNQAILQVRLLEKDSEIELLKVQLNTSTAADEQLRLTKAKLDTELLENKSKSDQIRVLTEQAEIVKKQHENEIREKDKCISELFSKLKAAEDASKPAFERTANLQNEIDELKRQLAKKEADLEKCGNCYDEMRKAEQLIEQIRLERDEVRSTLSKIPTCVICLDKRPQMLYMPCSHFICCEGCGNRFEQCPACRQKICGKITVYQ